MNGEAMLPIGQVHIASGHSQQFIAETINNHTTAAGPVDLTGLHPKLAREIVQQLPPYEAVRALNGIDAKKAAEIIGGMPPSRVVAFAGHMAAERLTPIMAHLRTDLADMLRLALEADIAMAARETQWSTLIGATKSNITPAGPSQRGTTGFRRDHDHGAMYWNQRIGLGMVTAEIAEYYTSHGGVGGRLGFPIRSQKTAGESRSGTHGAFQRFESTWDYPEDMSSDLGAACGATVYRSTYGTFSTFGGIGEYYERHGGTWGVLGFPVSDEIKIAGSETVSGTPGFRQYFEQGTVFWSEPTGAAHVTGDIATRVETDFRHLGFPLGDPQEEPSQFGTNGTTQRFQGQGEKPRTVCSSMHGTWLIAPEVAGYHNLHRAEFGFPLGEADPYPRIAGMIEFTYIQKFEGGAIAGSHGLGGIGSIGPFGLSRLTADLLSQEGKAARLSVPISEARPIDTGPDTVQFFSRGVVTVVDGTASAWYRNSAER